MSTVDYDDVTARLRACYEDSVHGGNLKLLFVLKYDKRNYIVPRVHVSGHFSDITLLT